MRLNDAQADAIRRIIQELAASSASVRRFGSRLDDEARRGDVELLVEVTGPFGQPASLRRLL